MYECMKKMMDGYFHGVCCVWKYVLKHKSIYVYSHFAFISDSIIILRNFAAKRLIQVVNKIRELIRFSLFRAETRWKWEQLPHTQLKLFNYLVI